LHLTIARRVLVRRRGRGRARELLAALVLFVLLSTGGVHRIPASIAAILCHPPPVFLYTLPLALA
jgi:UDP-N-acetylglucosamine:LPS N-acetylglucosamine transferase